MWRVLVLGSLLALAACGGAGEVGDHCGVDDDCEDKCQTGGGFPDGICTRECERSSDCPGGWVCISKSSGICMQTCGNSDECHDRFGERWTCDDEALQEGGGDERVCIGI